RPPDHVAPPFVGGGPGFCGFFAASDFANRVSVKNAAARPRSVSTIVNHGIVPSTRSSNSPSKANDTISDPASIKPIGALGRFGCGSSGIEEGQFARGKAAKRDDFLSRSRSSFQGRRRIVLPAQTKSIGIS